MNYQRIYNQLINNRQLNLFDGYTEKHHIIPKSHGGSNSNDNLVRLSAREHFIAHWLLWRIHRDAPMALAFKRMSNSDKAIRHKNSHGFYEARKAISNVMKGNTYGVGYVPTDEMRKKVSEFHSGKITSAETKAKISNSNTGKKRSAEAKLRISEASIGVSRPQKQTTCPHCSKNGALNMMTRYHFYNCKTLNYDN